jgi:hypothetical protein
MPAQVHPIVAVCTMENSAVIKNSSKNTIYSSKQMSSDENPVIHIQ